METKTASTKVKEMPSSASELQSRRCPWESIGSRLRTVNKHESLDGDGCALRRPVNTVQVVEVAAQALVEGVAATKSKGAVRANGPARGVDGTSLGWPVKLELVIGGNVSSATSVILHDTVRKSNLQGGAGLASDHLGSWGRSRAGGGRARGRTLGLTFRLLTDSSTSSGLRLMVRDG